MQMGAAVMNARVAYYVPEYRTQTAWLAAGAFLDGLLWISAIPFNHTQYALIMYSIGMIINLLCNVIPFVILKAKAIPYHIHHITNRCTLLFCIFGGELVLQLGIKQKKGDNEKHYKGSLFFCLLFMLMFLVQYAYSQLVHSEANHVLATPGSWKSFCWIQGHQLISYAILFVAVGVGKILDETDGDMYDPGTLGNKRALLFICLGSSVCQILLTSLRLLVKGCPRNRLKSKRTCSYIWRYCCSIGYMIIYAIFGSSELTDTFRTSPVYLFFCTFLIAFVSVFTDLISPEKHDHHHEEHGHDDHHDEQGHDDDSIIHGSGIGDKELIEKE